MAGSNEHLRRAVYFALLPLLLAVLAYLLDELSGWVVLVLLVGAVPAIILLGRPPKPPIVVEADRTPDIEQVPESISPVAPAIIDSLPDALVAIGHDRIVLESNRSARELLGSGLRGRDISQSLRHPGALESIDQAIADDDLVKLELKLLSPGERNFEMQVMPVSLLMQRDIRPAISDDMMGGAIVVLHDVTAQKRSEQMRADFVANASHELRTPLASLIGFIETLRTAAAEDPAAREKFLGIMANESGRMARLIDDLLSLSRIELDEHVQPTGQVDVEHLVKSVQAALDGRAAEKGMRIDVDIEAGIGAIKGEFDQVTQVLQNLIDNAIKYGREETDIDVKLYAVDRLPESGVAGIGMSVTNQGEVIPAEHLPRLTDRFYRVDPARSRTLGSTGLGLAIVKHIVSRHRGVINVQSSEQFGTKFTVLWPSVTR